MLIGAVIVLQSFLASLLGQRSFGGYESANVLYQLAGPLTALIVGLGVMLVLGRITAELPKLSDPAATMVLMTGDAPLGFIAPSLPAQVPVLRIDGWMMQPEDGSYLTGEMRRRVAAHNGPLFLIADAYDMGRASAAIVDYGLAIDWQKCRIFVTNLTGTYQWCPLLRRNW